MYENWYCPLPFRHAYVDSSGVAACCQTPKQPVLLQDWSQSSYLSQLQESVLSGTPPVVCQGCVKQEKTQGRSQRTDALKDYGHQRFEQTLIDFVDYRSNNVCNFKCRTCEPAFSHGIAVETKNSPVLKKFYKHTPEKIVRVTEQNADWIHQNIDVIKRLMITGGEPTFMPEVRKIVERVVYDGLDTDLLITTNASFSDDFWYEATRLHSRLHWTVSIDAVGSAAEIIRHGTQWNRVEKNVRWLASHAASMDINTVISNLNVLQLCPLLEFVREIQHDSRSPRGLHGTQGVRHQFHICQRPYHLAADNWPDDLKTSILAHLQQCQNLNLDSEQTAVVLGLTTSITQTKFDPDLWLLSQQYNQELDTIRNQNYNTLYN
jgi:organic radical activating enzyme